MHWLYLLLDIGTLFFPLILSFDKNVRYVKSWKNVFLSSLIIGVPFIVWDVFFTKNGVWGFNEEYITGIHIFNLPIEEVLFFIVVPFACIFIYECCKFYFKKLPFKHFNKIVIGLIFVYASFLFITNPLAHYTFWVFVSTLIVLIVWVIHIRYRFIGISFLISLLPFLIMNGVLTGAATEAPIVWYNDLHNTQMRLLTIPFEDVIYSFSLIVSTILTFEFLNKRSTK